MRAAISAAQSRRATIACNRSHLASALAFRLAPPPPPRAQYADVDEFYSYPCDLPEHTTRADIFCGQMTDRIAANGSIVPLLPRVAISEQFPASCNVRRHLRSGEGVNTEKVVLMRTRRRKDGKLRRLVTPHKTNWQYGRQGR